MSGAAFRVTTACYIHGKRYARGDVLTLDDRDTINALLSMNRIEGANDATAARVRKADTVRWSKGHPGDRPERPEDSLWVRRHP
jgi:hypothetical protein